MPRTVALVFTPDFSVELKRLAFHTPVWIAETPENRAAAEEAWHEAVEWPHISVTLFRPPEGEPTLEDWRTLLEQIAFQERALDALDVIGAPLSPAARAALGAAGLERLDETSGGFRARRD